jgi:hypothetical protein
VPVEDVAELLDAWRTSGGVWSRARVLSDGAARISRLTPEERHALTTALAEQGAPELAERLSTHASEHLDPRDAQAVADGILALDGDRIDELVTALQDPDRRTALTSAASRELPPPPPPPERAELVDLPPPGTADAQVPGRAPPAEGGRGPAQQASDAEPRRVPEPASPTPAEATTSPGGGRRDDGRVPRGRTEPTEPAARRPSPSGPATSEARGSGSGIAATIEQLQRAASAADRFHALEELGTPLSATEVVDLLDAVPDGWQRRRVVRQLLDAGSLSEELAPTVLAQLARPSDRLFIAGAMLDAATLGPAELDALLPPRAARRLAQRRRR